MRPKDFGGVSRRLSESGRPKQRGVSEAAEYDHVQSVRAQIEAIGRGDLEAALKHAREDVQLDIFAPPEFQWIRHARGIDELRRAIEHNFDSLEDQRPEILMVVAQGDTVIILGNERGIIRATGQPYDLQFVHRFTFVDGRLAGVRIVAARTETASSA